MNSGRSEGGVTGAPGSCARGRGITTAASCPSTTTLTTATTGTQIHRTSSITFSVNVSSENRFTGSFLQRAEGAQQLNRARVATFQGGTQRRSLIVVSAIIQIAAGCQQKPQRLRVLVFLTLATSGAAPGRGVQRIERIRP